MTPWKLFKLSDKWHALYGWLVNMRAASAPGASLGLEYTIQQARLKLIDNIIEYMNELEEEKIVKRNKGLFIRISDKELEVINSAWFDYIGMAGKPVSKSEFIRLAVKVFCARIISVIPPEEGSNGK